MKITPTSIAGVAVVETNMIGDKRGHFSRLFCMDELAPMMGRRQILQSNHSFTAQKGAIRGLHFQRPPHAEMKFVRCIKGRVLDVAVDLRASSPTFMQHYACELTADNSLMMVIPEGCAHGFQTLEDNCEMLYLHTAFYKKEAEGGLRHDDPMLGIKWPLPVTDISDRDRTHHLLTPAFKGIAA